MTKSQIYSDIVDTINAWIARKSQVQDDYWIQKNLPSVLIHNIKKYRNHTKYEFRILRSKNLFVEIKDNRLFKAFFICTNPLGDREHVVQEVNNDLQVALPLHFSIEEPKTITKTIHYLRRGYYRPVCTLQSCKVTYTQKRRGEVKPKQIEDRTLQITEYNFNQSLNKLKQYNF